MVRFGLAAAACIGAAAVLVAPAPQRTIRLLPAGVIELSSEMLVPANTEVRGAAQGTVLRAGAGFRGRAIVVCSGSNIRLHDFSMNGNRAALEVRSGLPPYDRAFARFTANNGILADAVSGLRISNIYLHEVAGFAVLVSRSRDVAIAGVSVEDSGSRNDKGRNNTTGGILLEEGTMGFRVLGCRLRRIRGNGVWTHSLYTSPRNADGEITGNRFEEIGRDAIQVGHATRILVGENSGTRIGFPFEDVDMEGRAIPVGIDTAGNVDESRYVGNRFEEVNGKCIDLDGFHDGKVTRNVCVNRGAAEHYPYAGYGIVMNNTNPDMQSRKIVVSDNEVSGMLFGGIFVIGSGHTVQGNRLLNLNTAHCNENASQFGCYYAPGEPEMLRSGIYLGRGAERPAPAHGNVIQGNEITGFRMAERCIAAAPGIAREANMVRGNICRDR